MILPGQTEAGSAGMQPCRGIAWWAHRDDDWKRENQPLALLPTIIGSKDPDALKIPARRAESTLTENAPSPFHAEPEHHIFAALSLIDQLPGVVDVLRGQLGLAPEFHASASCVRTLL
jgi:hypothetical protein